MVTIQFRLNAEQEAAAYDALQRSPARNLNHLGKGLFLEFLSRNQNAGDELAALRDKLEEIALLQEKILQMQDAADIGTLMNTIGAIFMLTYGAVPITVRKELDQVFNSRAVIEYMKDASG
jgi:hypothetical protein